jgi:CO/xanthine dehydrogenase FAD-binding subunit
MTAPLPTPAQAGSKAEPIARGTATPSNAVGEVATDRAAIAASAAAAQFENVPAPKSAEASAASRGTTGASAARRGASATSTSAAVADFDFHRPADLAEALWLLAEHPEAVPVAGGTDLMVAVNYRLTRPAAMLDLTGLAELREWADEGDAIRIGSGVPYARIIAELATVLPGLAAASRTVGSPQIRNRGTLGGNLATASPAGDGHPPLLATGATVEIASVSTHGSDTPARGFDTPRSGSRANPFPSARVSPTSSPLGDRANPPSSPFGGRAVPTPFPADDSPGLASPGISDSVKPGASPAHGLEHPVSPRIDSPVNPGATPFGGPASPTSAQFGGPADPSALPIGGPASSGGPAFVRTRTVPIAAFFAGPKRSVLQPGELITAVIVPKAAGPQQFLKVGTRNAMVIAVCSLAVALDLDARRLGTGIGSAGPTPLTAPEAERIELPWTRPGLFNDALAEEFGRRVAAAARPIDDVRGTADYRRHALAVCAARALRRVWTAAHRERTI